MSNITRRNFIGKSLAIGSSLSSITSLWPLMVKGAPRPEQDDISLAEWSLVGKLSSKEITNLDIPKICRETFDIHGLEYVNWFFSETTPEYLQQLKKNCNDYGIQSVLIMVDTAGALAATTAEARKNAVENHKKWIDIAKTLGCHAIRANCWAPQGATREEVLNYAEEGFGMLLEYAKEVQINLLVENHGGFSSEPDFLVSLMNRLESDDFGALPDFGNWADDVLIEGIQNMTPYAKGMSVKTYYDKDGNHPRFNVEAVIQMVHDLGYRGFWGIETEGKELDSHEQIRLTKKAIERVLWGKE